MLVKTDSQNYTDIADAIRELKGTADMYKPPEMASALNMLFFDYGVSYDAYDSEHESYATHATTYGEKVVGLTGNSYLESVTISEDAVEIGDYAFAYCGIEELTIPDTITKIGNYAFYECDNVKKFVIPDSVESIGDYAFYDCFNAAFSIPDSVKSIGRWAFYKCYNAQPDSFSIPEHVTRIEDYAFYYFGYSKTGSKLVIHANVDYIGSHAFAYSIFSDITFQGKPSSIGSYAFSHFKNAVINVPWAEGEVSGAPWGANATIHYNYVETAEV